MPAISTLRDNFTDNTQAPVWQQGGTTGSATAAETGGQAVFTLPSSAGAGPHEAYWKTQAVYDLTGDSFYITIGTMVATGVAATAYFRLYLDDNDYVQWTQTSNTLKAQKVLNGVATDLYSVSWSSTTYKYLRIRESGGSILFDSSSNGTSWTNRATTTVGSTFAVTALGVWFGAVCANVASPGSFRLDDVNILLPALSTTWRWTEVEWPLLYRFKSVTVSGANGVGYLATSADGSAWRYFSGPAGSKNSASIQLTEQSQANAETMAVDLPLDGRWDLPTMVEARFLRLYHRSKSGSYTLYEYYPRRLVQSDDIEAESIRAINIAAHQITADHIDVLNLDATAYITAGAGAVRLDETGISIVAPDQALVQESNKIVWKTGADVVGEVYGFTASGSYYRTYLSAYASPTQYGELFLTAEGLVVGEEASIALRGSQTAGTSLITLTSYLAYVLGGLSIGLSAGDAAPGELRVQNDATLRKGLNVGTATGAGVGEINTSGAIDISLNDAVTNTVSNLLTLRHLSTGTPAGGFGTDININLESTTAERAAALIRTAWITATDASRAARLRFFVFDTAARIAMDMEASGTAPKIGFLGAAAVARPTVSGSRGGNAALASALTALASLGLITDSSTA